MSKRKLIGQMLVDRGTITKDQLKRGLEFQQKSAEKIKLGEALVKLGFAREMDVLQCVGEQFDIPVVDLGEVEISVEAIDSVPKQTALNHRIMPISKENGVIRVAMPDLDLFAVDSLRFILESDVQPVLAPPEQIEEAIEQYYGGEESTVDNMLQEFTSSEATFSNLDEGTVSEGMDEESKKTVGAPGAGDEADSAPIIRLVTMLIGEAVRNRASDIHIEPMANRVRIRYRIDGECQEIESPPKRLQNAVLARVKLMSKMDIAEKRKCQDGRIAIKAGGKALDLRVSVMPATNGETVVMRLLLKESILLNLSDLGFHETDYQRFQSIIRRPNGIFLVTGPTGSGKTTTLYAALNELNRPDRKIITAEDPVEYNLSGINQCEVREDIQRTFGAILRAMLRQAPNIILVGEIRDQETAEIAITAALTGHLVFSTLHTNDAPSAIARLIDIGVKPFLVASAIQAIMAQRLVRKICDNCKQPYEYPAKMLMAVGLRPDDLRDITLFKGTGCSYCHDTGYRGRCAISEMLEMNPELRELAFKKAPTHELRARARAHGMLTLTEDGVRKALQGVTTIDEVISIAGAMDQE
ncbi:MAG TPA: ATPase, T2SS/T4P/T4SS family [Candidatus Brocadiia bacterium]|nr:ATPase, T2SS/T4P/T4SS family [Candidatus Brocadiia bacterium]